MMTINRHVLHIIFFSVLLILLASRSGASTESLSEKNNIRVQSFTFSGNTIFSDQQIRKRLKPFENKTISAEELQNAASQITLAYVREGYINSGAVIPDQTIKYGIITIEIIEGSLDAITITGNRTLSSGYITKRIRYKTPLNMNDLQQELKRLKGDQHIKNVHARLSPGSTPGSASLNVTIVEAPRLSYGMTVNNHASPGTGSLAVENRFSFLNVTGLGDDLNLDTQMTDGLKKITGKYTVPFGGNGSEDWILSIEASGSDSKVISDPFNELDITGRSQIYAMSLTRPLIKRVEHQFSAGVKLEYYTSTTYLDGNRFSFSENAENGQTTISSVKCSQEYIMKSMNHVLAFRLTENFGTDLINPTRGSDGSDGKYLSVKGQMQYLQRVAFRNSTLRLNVNFQLAGDSLPPSERFSAGGPGSVRGYRKNYLDNDQGIESSLEFNIPLSRLKLPLISKKAGDGDISIAPFIDYAYAGNYKDPESTEKISGAGLGLLWTIRHGVNAELYGARSLKEYDKQADYDLQDKSIYFKLSADF